MINRQKKMRNKNRAWDTPMHVVLLSTRTAGVVVLVLFVAVLYAIVSHSQKALNREIVVLEREQRKLTNDLGKERIRWNELRTPAKLVTALHRHGIAMAHPAATQLVYMEPTLQAPRAREDLADRPVYVSR